MTTMNKVRVYPYTNDSRSAKLLSRKFNGKVLRRANSRYTPEFNHTVINWGSSTCPVYTPATTLNADVSVAQCKLASFKALRGAGVMIPEFWEDRAQIPNDAFLVVCRSILKGSGGEGITIANNVNQLINAPLYTKYIKKKHEYRVHIVVQPKTDGIVNYIEPHVFYVQRKARKLDVAEPDWQVQNLAGGFVYIEPDENTIPKEVLLQARSAVVAVGLDFGAVDVLWNEHKQQAFVLEVNTAPGLEDRTADKYYTALKSIM